MPNDQKVKRKKQGEHLERNKTKIAIVEFILSNNKEDNEPGIPESKIRECLEDQYGMTDKDNIRKHLKDLLGDTDEACLEKFPYKKPGLPNYWDITKVKHLSKISNKFHDIKLNKYEKSLLIVVQKNGYDIFTFKGIQFYVQLLLSESFFKACLDTNAEILDNRSQLIYADKNPLDAQDVEETIINCYLSYNNRYPNLGISIDSFMSIIKQMSQREISFPETITLMRDPQIVKKSFTEEFMKIWEEELLGLSKETANDMHKDTMENDLRIYWEMAIAAYRLKRFNYFSESMRYNLLFEYYVHGDIINGISSEEERMYAREARANEEEFRNSVDAIMYAREMRVNEKEFRDSIMDKDDYESIECLSERRIIRDLELESRILSKYKHPSVFGDIYNDPLTACRGIFKFLYQHTDQIKYFMPCYERESISFLSDESAWDKWTPNNI